MLASALPPAIVTPRLLLRQYAPADGPALRELVSRNYPDLLESFPKTVALLARPEGAADYIRDKAEVWNARAGFWYGLWLRDAGQVGQLQVKNLRWEIPAAELGYFIDRDYRGRGLAYEALRAIVQVCLNERGFRRVFLRVVAGNVASMRLAEKAGFRAEGRHANEFRCGNGRLHDSIYYAITEPEPAPPHEPRRHRLRRTLRRLIRI